jgi:spore germination protein GerM
MLKKYFKNLITISLLTFVLISCAKNGPKSNSSEDTDGKKQVTIYFTKASDELGVVLIPVVRNITEGRTKYETAFRELFLGPTIKEKEKLKLNTEIPEGTRLIKVEELADKVNIDVSGQFMSGGGSETMQARFRQLRETALTNAKGRPVFLYIDGELSKRIGGEGLEVPQPLGAKLD